MHWCNSLRRFDLRGALAAWLFLCLSVAGSRAATPEEVYASIVSTIVQPGFGQVEKAAQSHARDWDVACSGGKGDLASVIGSFHDLADAWAAVEMFRSGPAAKDFRRDRFYLWPERKNAVARALAAALSTPDSVSMDDAWMQQQSAAIQGLPALERLLFDDGEAKASLLPGSATCRLGVAVSRNAARLASLMLADWASRAKSSTPADRTALATDIVTGIALSKDEKLEAVIGKSEAQVKPRAAEFWRSRRSLRNLALNLETYGAIAKIMVPFFESPVMTYAATTSSQTVAGMREPLSDYGKTTNRSEAYFLRAALDSLGDSAANEVSAALGVTVGFNSSDGD